MLKLAVSNKLAQNVLHGKQDAIITDHDCNDAGDLITLVNKDTNKPILYASIDSCACDASDHLFTYAKHLIKDLTQQDFNQAINNHKLAFILKISQPQSI